MRECSTSVHTVTSPRHSCPQNTQVWADVDPQKHSYTLQLLKQLFKTLTSAKTVLWIFIGCLRSCQDCSILARGGPAINGDESRKSLLLIGVRTHYRRTATRRNQWRPDTRPNLNIHASLKIHPPPLPLPLKPDTIYMSWREVTGSNQPWE